jgi:hypothetical protein
MLSVLFAALGKKKGDEGAMLLVACADMFSATNEAIGHATGLWKPISRHPLVLALAIKKLIATAVFTSCAELREAMNEVRGTLEMRKWAMEYIVDLIERADEIVFVGDRAAWDAAYADVGSDVVKAMLGWVEMQESPYTDDDDVDHPGSPRWAALNAIVEAKLAVPVREAAAKPLAKQSRKPKLAEAES